MTTQSRPRFQVKAKIHRDGATVDRWPCEYAQPPTNREELARMAGFDSWDQMRKNFPGPYPTTATLTITA